MKVNFGDYTYINDSISDDDTNYKSNTNREILAYNSEYFDNLVNQRRYEEAYDYASHYHFNDPAKQKQYENYLYNFQREGRKMTAIYSNADENDLNALDFYMNVFSDGGTDKLSDENEYGRQFNELKNSLGTFDATSLSVTFQPKTRKFLGIDFLARDNENNYEEFLDRAGLTQQDLELAGITSEQADGKTTLKFSKSNKLANKILLNLDNVYRKGESDYMYFGRDYGVELKAFDSNGRLINNIQNNRSLESSNGNILRNQAAYALGDMKRLYKSAADISTKYINPIETTTKVYSSTIGTFIEDGLEQLRVAKEKGEISGTDYKREMDERYGDITSTLKSLNGSAYRIYSNSFRKNPTDNTMVELSNEEKSWAINDIAGAEDFSLQSMISNGQIGTLVTIYATPEPDKELDNKTDSKDAVKAPSRQFFIPGLFHEKAQAALNADTRTRASQELNTMQDYGYEYKTADGNTLKFINETTYELNGKPIRVDEALATINKDLIIQDAVHNLKYQFMDAQGNINKSMYMQVAQGIAYNAIKEIYGNQPFMTMNLQELGIGDLFAMKGVGTDVATQYKGLINFDVYKRIIEAYKIYDFLIDDMNNYNR